MLAAGRRRGTQPLALKAANRVDSFNGLLAPTTERLCSNGNKVDTRSSAGGQIGCQLALSCNMESMAGIFSSIFQGQLLEWRDNRDIKCSGSTASPEGEENIGRTRAGTWDKARGLLSRGQGSRVSSCIDNIT